MDWRLAFEPAEMHNSNFLATARAAVTRVAKRTQLAMNGLPYEE